MKLTAAHLRHNFGGVLSVQGLFAVIVWGASFMATRVALGAMNPFGLIAVRLWTGALLLLLIVRARGGRVVPARADLPVCVFLGAVLSLHLLIQAYGLQYTSAINTGWIVGFMPVTIALGAYLLRKQRLDALGWLGVLAGTAGVLIVTLVKPPDFANAPFGNLLQLSSCLTWTVYTLVATGPNARNGVLRVTTFGMIVAAAIATVATFWSGVLTGPLTSTRVLAIAFLGVVCSGLAFYTWFAAVKEHGPARVGALLYIEPFVSMATGALLLDEHVTINAVLGGVCVLVGVWLVAKGSVKPGTRVAVAERT